MSSATPENGENHTPPDQPFCWGLSAEAEIEPLTEDLLAEAWRRAAQGPWPVEYPTILIAPESIVAVFEFLKGVR